MLAANIMVDSGHLVLFSYVGTSTLILACLKSRKLLSFYRTQICPPTTVVFVKVWFGLCFQLGTSTSTPKALPIRMICECGVGISRNKITQGKLRIHKSGPAGVFHHAHYAMKGKTYSGVNGNGNSIDAYDGGKSSDGSMDVNCDLVK